MVSGSRGRLGFPKLQCHGNLFFSPPILEGAGGHCNSYSTDARKCSYMEGQDQTVAQALGEGDPESCPKVKVKVLVAQSCLTLCDPTDCSLPGSSVHGILQARILEWVAIPFSRGSSQPRDQTQVASTAGGFFSV